MILLDTHVWVWWVSGDPALRPHHRKLIEENIAGGIGVSVISCWEIAMLAASKRLQLTIPVMEWIGQALAYPGVQVVNLTPAIAVGSTQLPDGFHKDPADRMIVATAQTLACPLLTSDERILRYAHAAAV